MAVSFNPPATGPRPTGRPVVMESDHAILVSAGPEDVPLLRRWMADPLVAGPMGRLPEDHPPERIAAYVARFDRLLDHLLVIRDKASNAPLGFAVIAIDGRNRIATITISIGERRRGSDTQLALSAAARAICAWVFETVGLRKLVVQVAQTNARTAAWVGERMTLEAELRDELLMQDGTTRTLYRYGMLRPEWDALKAWFQERDRAGIAPTLRRHRPERAGTFEGARPPWDATRS